ncbi:MAG: hypothetical protein IKN71_06905 [Alphaproteobacteria bacterium]|nr:hypothetical protein [Alphaproteobacteria bacterium]
MIRKRNSTKNTIMLDELNTAIAIGDYNSVNELLENNLDLNSTDTIGYP